MDIRCKKCGNTKEFYMKEKYKGTCDFYFRTDKTKADNSEMYDYAQHSYRSKFIFCADCDSKVGKIEDYFPELLGVELWE